MKSLYNNTSHSTYQITYKVNGHIKKIRTKSPPQLITDISNEITYYLQRSSVSIIKPKQLFNINIRQVDQLCDKNRQGQQQQQLSLMIEKENENISLLREQIKLFQSLSDIRSFVQTEKNISFDIEEELTQLLEYAIRICWELLKENNTYEVMRFSTDSLTEINNLSHSRDLMLIRENLDKIQDNCLQTLNRIKDERRRLQTCAICFTNKSNTILIPCMHLGTCSSCSSMIITCPFCKSLIEQKKNIYQQ